jgi:hypothetical protein
MRRHISSKSNTCTESLYVYAAGISVKAGAHYPGRPVNLPKATTIVRLWEGLTEVSRGHTKAYRSCRRAEREVVAVALNFDDEGDAE